MLGSIITACLNMLKHTFWNSLDVYMMSMVLVAVVATAATLHPSITALCYFCYLHVP